MVDKTIPLLTEHMVPQTDSNFMIETYDSQFIYLRDIMTGRKKILIQGSCFSDKKFPSVLFLQVEDGYDLHFCTKKYDMGSYLHTWYRWNLGFDFLLMLNKFSRLPLELPIDKLIQSLN